MDKPGRFVISSSLNQKEVLCFAAEKLMRMYLGDGVSGEKSTLEQLTNAASVLEKRGDDEEAEQALNELYQLIQSVRFVLSYFVHMFFPRIGK